MLKKVKTNNFEKLKEYMIANNCYIIEQQKDIYTIKENTFKYAICKVCFIELKVIDYGCKKEENKKTRFYVIYQCLKCHKEYIHYENKNKKT